MRRVELAGASRCPLSLCAVAGSAGQPALVYAAVLRVGPGRPRGRRAVAPDAGTILRRNVYGWFERCEHGIYRLTSLGEAALQRWTGAAPGKGALLLAAWTATLREPSFPRVWIRHLLPAV